MAELLVMALDKPHGQAHQPADYERDYPLKGQVVAVRPDGWEWGTEEALPNFIRVTVTGVTFAQAKHYMDTWRRVVDVSTVPVNPTLDTYTLTLSVQSPVRASDGHGGITAAMVNNVFFDWNLPQPTLTQTSATALADVGQVLQSNGFWSAEVIGAVFSDSFADPVHTLTVDYSALGIHPNRAALRAITRGGDVVSNANGVMVVQFTAGDAIAAFREAIKDQFQDRLMRRRWRFRPAAVDSAVAAGGSVTITPTQAQANLVAYSDG